MKPINIFSVENRYKKNSFNSQTEKAVENKTHAAQKSVLSPLEKDTVSFKNTFSHTYSVAQIQSHKDIGGTIAFGKYPENYIKLINREFVEYQPERIVVRNGKERIIKARPAHYEETFALLPHYHIDKLWTTGKGSGTRAIQMVVEKSLKDKETCGRVTLDASCIDGKTSPAGFYYKLGFRFLNEISNQECENWLKAGGKRENAPFITGTMYLPSENILHCLKYGTK